MTSPRLHCHHWDASSSEAPTWILLHGFIGSGADFDILASHWEGRPQLIAPDLPGFGLSAPPDSPPDLDHLCSCLLPLIKKLPSPPLLLGYSMGARLALGFTVKHPQRIRGLTLVGGTAGIPDASHRKERRLHDQTWIDLIQTSGTENFLEQWQKQAVIQSQLSVKQPWRNAMLARRQQLKPEVLAKYLSAFGTGSMPSLWSELKHLELPTLLLTGAGDNKFNLIAKDMQGKLPHATHVSLPNCGHAAAFEQPASCAQALHQWSASIPSPA